MIKIKVCIFFIGLILFISGIVNLILGIINAIILNPPFYGVVGIIVGVFFIFLGYMFMHESDSQERAELEAKKRKVEEKKAKATELRKRKFLEQELWRNELKEGNELKKINELKKRNEVRKDKFCSGCGKIVRKNEHYCQACGIEVLN